MSFLADLYQEVILDHNRRPRNFGQIEDPSGTAEGYNPLCGDRVKVYIKKADGVIEDVAFQGTGCAISTASASIMTEVLKGKTIPAAIALFDRFHDLVMGNGELEMDTDDPDMEKLAVFQRVGDYPVRVKCATLVWHALRAALDNATEPVKTE